MCGICMPHCPTFGLTQHEADGPRGRIRLMLSLAEQSLEADQTTQAHLQSCLGCRACEQACPSNVAYGSLIDQTRSYLAQTHPEAHPGGKDAERIRWWRDQILSHPNRLAALWHLQQTFATGWLRPVAGKLAGPLAPLMPNKRMKPSTAAPPASTPASNAMRIVLYSGCTGKSANRNVRKAAKAVLKALGFMVVEPGGQRCCGAMHQHDGAVETAEQLRTENRELLRAANPEAVVVLGTACTAELQALTDLDCPVIELSHFLTTVDAQHWPTIHPLQHRVLVHTPCSQRNALGQAESSFLLLQRIPGLDCQPLAENERCCGAGGLQALYFPEQAQKLLRPKLDDAHKQNADSIVSANVGCVLHMQNQTQLPVYHPVELIAQAMARS